MSETDEASTSRRPRIGSLFSGYGGLDLAVEEVFDGRTIWFSEINDPVARVFTHHWPQIPNLGDITTIDWTQVEPVDILCGGFPCQDVSTVGRGAGLAPGTRSGLWSHMAEAIDALQPQLVVIENVRGLLSAPATRPRTKGAPPDERNPVSALAGASFRDVEPEPWLLGDNATGPLRALGAVLGDLADLGRNARWIGVPASVAGAPHPRFRIFIASWREEDVPNAAGFGLLPGRRDLGAGPRATRNDRTLAPDHRPSHARTGWLTEQVRRLGEPAVPGERALHRWGRYADAIAEWEHITDREAPASVLLNSATGPRPAPEFVEWLMGLPLGWVTNTTLGLTATQQNTALGNGVLPLQAAVALIALDVRL